MPLPIVPPVLLNGLGLFAHTDEPHAQPGNHLRISSHPLLGLPVAPYIVWRGIKRTDQEFDLRDSVVFTNSAGRLKSPPFRLTPSDPVIATLVFNQNESSIWARVQANPVDGNKDAELVAEAFVSSLFGPVSLASRDSPPYAFSGPGIVQILLTGSAIIRGVQWMEHAIDPFVEFQPWAALNLPTPGGARYASIENPVLHATARLCRQAPKKLPLHETLGLLAPASAPSPPLGFEVARVASLTQPLGADLASLINDTSQLPHEQVIVESLEDESGVPIGEVQTSRLQRVLQTQLDPGAASFAGFKTYDEGSAGFDAGFVFYWIDAYYANSGTFARIARFIGNRSEAPLLDVLTNNLSARHRIGSRANLIRELRKPIASIDGVSLDETNLPALEQRNDYIGVGTLVVIDVEAPPLPVAAPRIEDHQQIGWLPEAPFEARREVRLDVAGVGGGHLLAVEKCTLDAGDERASLNSINDAGFHLPLALAVNTDDETQAPLGKPGSGFISDRQAAPVDIRYGVAQQDRFGRWSNWHAVKNAPTARPNPPRPILEVTYTQPSLPNPSGSMIARGTVRVRVPIPLPESLAPASFGLQSLELEVEDLTTRQFTERSIALPDPVPDNERLDTTFAAPRLAPTERRQLRLRARWKDDSGRPAELAESVYSELSTLTLHDPRAPDETVNVVNDLSYSARPDVTGRAVIEHDWTAASTTVRYAVYYTDENRLRAYLQQRVDGGDASTDESNALIELNTSEDAPARAGAYRRNASLFPGHLFERLDNAVIEFANNQRRFQHTVSGQLRLLNIYRISAESEVNARPGIFQLPLIIYAVPNDDPPPTPLLRITASPTTRNDEPFSVEATVTLASAGSTPAARLRLRRSSLGATDPLRMPIVLCESATSATGFSPVVAMGTASEGQQLATAIDSGPLLIKDTATLQPWVRYHWVAEVQGADAPGSTVASSGDAGQIVQGLWSVASAPVSLMLIPPNAPAPVDQLIASGIDPGNGQLSNILLNFKHVESLSGGAQGSYQVRIDRRSPDAEFAALKQIDIAGTGLFELDGAHPDPETPNEAVAPGTVYRVTIIDPLGRLSEPMDATLVAVRR